MASSGHVSMASWIWSSEQAVWLITLAFSVSSFSSKQSSAMAAHVPQPEHLSSSTATVFAIVSPFDLIARSSVRRIQGVDYVSITSSGFFSQPYCFGVACHCERSEAIPCPEATEIAGAIGVLPVIRNRQAEGRWRHSSLEIDNAWVSLRGRQPEAISCVICKSLFPIQPDWFPGAMEIAFPWNAGFHSSQ
jgi:hypothetical protein